MKHLLQTSDVLIENFKAGGLAKLLGSKKNGRGGEGGGKKPQCRIVVQNARFGGLGKNWVTGFPLLELVLGVSPSSQQVLNA